MLLFRLKRIANTYRGVFGELKVWDGEQLILSCYTVERPWKNNTPFVSCIPAGAYTLKRGWFNKKDYEVFVVLDVPGRTYIKIHIANKATELLGCIAPGTRLGTWENEWCVLGSKNAFDSIMECLEGHDEAHLIIYWGGNPE